LWKVQQLGDVGRHAPHGGRPLSLWPSLKHTSSLPDRQPRPRSPPGEVGEDRPRLVETAAGEKHALDPLLVLGPKLDLVEITVVRQQRLVSLFV
jgi:hypothetical protein